MVGRLVIVLPKACDPRTFRVTFCCLCTICFGLTTVLFAGLFGAYYSEWFRLNQCTSQMLLADGIFDHRRHCLHFIAGHGLHAANGNCPNECDQLLHNTYKEQGGLASASLNTRKSTTDCFSCCNHNSCATCGNISNYFYIKGCQQRCEGKAVTDVEKGSIPPNHSPSFTNGYNNNLNTDVCLGPIYAVTTSNGNTGS